MPTPKKSKPAPKKAPPKAEEKVIDSLKQLTREELKEIYNVLLYKGVKDLQSLKDKKGTTVLMAMVISVVQNIVTKGDIKAFDMLMDRLVGKEPEGPLAGITPAQSVQVRITLPANGREAHLKKNPT